MSQDEAIDQSTSTSNSKITLKSYNPRKPSSVEDLAIIIASHDKLLAWNNATEIALKFDARSKNTDTTLIQNIRNTAALIISSERSTFSQNFELRRARNLSDSTLSTSEILGGFAEGILYEATAPIRKMVDIQQPSSMKLSDSNKRVDDLENMIMLFGSRALEIVKQIPTTISYTASFTWKNPDVMAKSIAKAANNTLETYSHSIDKIPSVIAHGLKSNNPEQAIGFSSGVIAFGVIKEAFGSTGKKMRDFSKDMSFEFQDAAGNISKVAYAPMHGHLITGHVSNGTLRFDVMKADGERYGYGGEMFASMIKKFEDNGVKIDRIQAAWETEGPKSTNGRQFLNAEASGLSRKEAAFKTFTGQQAETLNMDDVIVPPMVPIDKTIHPLYFRSKDQHSSLDSQTVVDAVVTHLKTLGLPPEKEQIAVAYVELKRQVNLSHDDSISA
jgi:hypothetical protein